MLRRFNTKTITHPSILQLLYLPYNVYIFRELTLADAPDLLPPRGDPHQFVKGDTALRAQTRQGGASLHCRCHATSREG